MQPIRTVLAIAVAAFLWAPVSPAVADEPLRTISLNGTGTVSPPADMATIAVGVETSADRASQAIAKNAATARKIFQAAESAGIAKDDIQTRNFSVQPRYSDQRQSGSRSAPEIIGYVVVNEVTLTLRDIGAVGETLDAMLSAGANRINSIRFGLQNPDDAMDQARKAAVDDAKAKATLYSHAAGVELGEIISITEGGGSAPRPKFAEMRATASAVPIAAGTSAVHASVHIVWRIEEQ